jgi:hypothetical protein
MLTMIFAIVCKCVCTHTPVHCDTSGTSSAARRLPLQLPGPLPDGLASLDLSNCQRSYNGGIFCGVVRHDVTMSRWNDVTISQCHSVTVSQCLVVCAALTTAAWVPSQVPSSLSGLPHGRAARGFARGLCREFTERSYRKRNAHDVLALS